MKTARLQPMTVVNPKVPADNERWIIAVHGGYLDASGEVVPFSRDAAWYTFPDTAETMAEEAGYTVEK